MPQQGTAEIKLEATPLFSRSITAKVMEGGLRQKRLRTIRQLQTSEQRQFGGFMARLSFASSMKNKHVSSWIDNGDYNTPGGSLI